MSIYNRQFEFTQICAYDTLGLDFIKSGEKQKAFTVFDFIGQSYPLCFQYSGFKDTKTESSKQPKIEQLLNQLHSSYFF